MYPWNASQKQLAQKYRQSITKQENLGTGTGKEKMVKFALTFKFRYSLTLKISKIWDMFAIKSFWRV